MKQPRFIRIGTAALGAWFFIAIAAVAIVGFFGAVVGTIAGLR